MRAIAPSCSTKGAPAAHRAMMNPAPTWGGSRPLRIQTTRVPTAGMTTKLAPSTENTVRRSRICAAKVRSGVRSPIESIDAIANAGTLMSISRPRSDSNVCTVAGYAPAAGPRSEPAVVGGGPHGLRTAGHAQLADRGGDVVAHGALGQEQGAGDLSGGGAAGGDLQHLGLLRRQGAGTDGQRLRGQLRVDHPQTLVDPADRVHQPVHRGVLDHEALGAGLHGAAQVPGPPESGQDDDAGCSRLALQLLGNRDAVLGAG